MKSILVTFLLLIASMAFGQSIVSGSIGMQAPFTNTVVMPDHAEHASQHAMGTEQNLYGSHLTTLAQGERPLWEFGDNKNERPLGDIAREYRAVSLYDLLHPDASKKAVITLEK
jgi:hypothetical protein